MAASRARGSPRTARVGRSRPHGRVTGTPVRATGTIIRAERRAPETVLDLQRRAGNSAVVRLLQRAPLGTSDDPKGYTSATGVKNVAASGMTRREVRGLKYGVKGGFQSTYTSKSWDKATKTWKEKVRSSAEAKMTKESPDNMAVVVMPDTFVRDRPVQVVLHFHGWGFRGGTDPYAGYLVASGEKGGAGSARGTVRDVDQEHWAQQIGAVNAERAAQNGPQTIAILAQGRGMSDFGNVPTFDYVQDVLSRVPELKGVTQYSIVVSGHSGGGSTQVAKKVTAGDALTRDRSKLPAPKPGQAAPQPADLVVLFDAEGIESVASWAVGQIDAVSRSIRIAATPAAAQAVLAAIPKFRGYFAAGGAYAKRYDTANNQLLQAFRKLPPEWTQIEPADPKAVKVPDLFRIIQVPGAGHEQVISGGKDASEQQGALADALRVTSDPTIDRDRAFGQSKMRVRPTATTTTAPTKAQPTVQRAPATLPTVNRAWTTKSAADEYALTQDERTLLSSQTSDERSADVKAITAGRARIRALERLKKQRQKRKQSLTAAEEQELTDLKALQERTESAQRALKRLDVEEILVAAGFTVSGWFGDVQTGSFLGIGLRVHKSLADKLTRAETALVGDQAVNPTKLGAAELGKTLNMYASTSDLRAPKKAIGGSSLSLHTFGLAVDLNYRGNPFLGNAGKTAPDVVKRATSLVNGTAVDVLTPLGDARASFTALKAASDAMETYFSYRDPAQQAALAAKVGGHKALAGEPTDVAGWRSQIDTDYTALKDKGDFEDHAPPEEGFLDFDERVVLALTGAGLTWGGTYGGAKDIMHFDNRTSGDGAKVHTARVAHTGNK